MITLADLPTFPEDRSLPLGAGLAKWLHSTGTLKHGEMIDWKVFQAWFGVKSGTRFDLEMLNFRFPLDEWGMFAKEKGGVYVRILRVDEMTKYAKDRTRRNLKDIERKSGVLGSVPRQLLTDGQDGIFDRLQNKLNTAVARAAYEVGYRGFPKLDGE